MSEGFLFRWQRAICNAPNPTTWKRGTPKPELTSDQLPPIAKHVALTLAVYMDMHGKSAFPSLTELHDATGRSRKTIGRVLQKLKAAGFIRYTDHGREGKRGVTRHYEACLPDDLTSVPRTPLEESTSVLPTSTSVLRTVNERSQNALPSHYQSNNSPERWRTTLPPDFELTPELREWAEKNVRPGVDVDYAVEKFIAYNDPSTGRVSSDWDAKARNWLEAEMPPRASGKGSGWDAVLAASRKIHPDKPDYADKIVAACKDHFGVKPRHALAAIQKGATSIMGVLAAAGREAGIS